MTTHAQRTVSIALLALACWVAGDLAADTRRDSALGPAGELYTLEHGSYGELFAQPYSSEAANPVLALRIERPEAPVDRVLVAGTGGAEVEGAAALVYEESSQTLFVAWESTSNYIHSRIRLAGYSNGSWTDAIDVSDTRFSLKSSPRLAITREAYRGQVVDDAGDDRFVHRTVLHAVWVEDRAEGRAVVYAPLVLVNGAYSGSHSIFNLLDFVAVAPEQVLPVPLAELPLAPAIERGAHDLAVVAGFVDPRTGRLVTVELGLLSGEISAATDAMRGHMIDIGNRYLLGEPGDLTAFADAMRGHMIDIGHHLDQRLLAMIADDFRSKMLALGADYEGELTAFADAMRGHMIDIGVRLQARGLSVNAAASGSGGVMDLPAGDVLAGAVTSNVFTFNIASNRSLPEIGAAARLFLSADGTRALVAWEEDGRIDYRESAGAGWTVLRSLPLDQLGGERAYEILEERIQNR